MQNNQVVILCRWDGNFGALEIFGKIDPLVWFEWLVEKTEKSNQLECVIKCVYEQVWMFLIKCV